MTVRLLTLGTAGGPMPVSGHKGIATALVVDDAAYLIDCGRGAVSQFVDAGLQLDQLRAVFLTHLHADHVGDYPGLLLYGWNNPQLHQHGLPAPLHVYGPGPAGDLPPSTDHRHRSATYFAEEPTPGTEKLTSDVLAGFAYHLNIFHREAGYPDPRELVRPHDITLPDGLDAGPLTATAPPMPPFEVYRDDHVIVTAILVAHGGVYPSFAFRFDTAGGSIAFSGDTSPTPNIVTLATGADVLVHEAISLPFLARLGMPKTLIANLQRSHTELPDVEKAAQQAGVHTLVLTHLIPIDNKIRSQRWWESHAGKTFTGTVIVARDGGEVVVHAAAR